ncbi:DegT/DnrJ/EryC1/StrS family aminotransferase [Candidatus Uhrbacteria bacterium]|nr:DegT/DnrJ/EryC1/StrS family aminotransferase [Candidatus Uhrbacteria bacterium]
MDRVMPIYVTQPGMPPMEEFTALLKQIWESKILTNNGPFHQQFEKELADYLGVKYISLFANGTLALITALQTLRITGEVITTPYSFVATTHALWWNNIKPVFADIESDYFNLDPEKVEAAITPQTTAILPVHVYGNPCKMERFQKIAKTHNLKLIFDAAQAFGVKINENSVLNFGDLSILSFHATKVFNTFEGGAIVCHDQKMKERIDLLKNFGYAGETTVIEPGINAKMNEIQAAFGLLQLKHVDQFVAQRKTITELYRTQLIDVPGISFFKDMPGVDQNYSYFPILIDAGAYGKTRDEVYNLLKQHNIYARRYFYPLITQFPTYKEILTANPKDLPFAEKITEQVLCLPIYPNLAKDEVILICELIRNNVRS